MNTLTMPNQTQDRFNTAEQPMPKFIRRSVYPLSIDDAQLADKAYASNADAILLDFVKQADRDWQADLKARMPAAIHAAGKGGAEIFVRIHGASAAAELEATVFNGVAGVVLRGVTSPTEIQTAALCLSALEASRGLPAGSLEIDVEIDTAGAVWHALDIARASERFGVFFINEPALCKNLGMQAAPTLTFDPLEYIKSQIITVAIARDTGFKGAVCEHASWIAHCNAGFRPTEEEAAYYVKVIEVFAEGLKRGMASVPIDGKMIDVPVDLRAKLYLKWANRVKARDAAKAAAHR